jgi:Ca-activated chloride channel family protein
VGLGTQDGHVAEGEGMAIYLKLDEPTLREVARLTGGEYHHAGTAEALRAVYQKLGSRVQTQTRDTELTALLALLAVMLIVAGASVSMLWFGRVV